MRLAPWQVKGIGPHARETAREAARRCGMSLGQWLNAVILDQAAEEGITGASDDDWRGEDLVSINARLDDLGRQIDRLAVPHPAASADHGGASHQIAEAVVRLNGRLEQLIAEGRSASSALERRVDSVDQALARLGRERVRAAASYVDEATAEAVARLRALDAEFATPSSATLQRPAPASLQCRADEALERLRKDLAAIGRTLAEAMPREAVEALESEVRALGRRLDAERQAGADASAFAGLEQGLHEVRDALRALTPAESLVGFDEAIRTLASKIDVIAGGRQDAAGLQQLESAIASLRALVGQVASSDALAALAQEVRGLAERMERGVPASGSSDVLAALERRIGTIADAIETMREQNGRNASPQLDQLMSALNDKLGRLQSVPDGALSRAEQLVLGGLEDRISRLMEKLDASEHRLGRLETIERGVTELLAHLEALRTAPPRAAPAARAAPPDAPAATTETPSRDIAAARRAESAGEQRSQDAREDVHGTMELMGDRLAIVESHIGNDRGPPASAPEPALASEPSPLVASAPRLSANRAAPTARPAPATRAPIDPSLPPDHPLEPGSGPPRPRAAASAAPGAGAKPGAAAANAAERVAASEAPLRANGVAVAPESKTDYLQAARRAAQLAQAAQRGERVAATADPDKLGSKLSQRLKMVLVGLSVAVLIVVALRFAASYFQFAELVLPHAPAVAEHDNEAPVVVMNPQGAARRAEVPRLSIVRPTAAPASPPEPPPIESASSPATVVVPPVTVSPPPLLISPPSPAPPPASSGTDQSAAPAAGPVPAPPASAPTTGDVTGALALPPWPHPAMAPAAAPPAATGADRLPPSIGGPALIAAATAGEPAAAYEVATRFAEGRGVPQSAAQAAIWYERAATAGLAPALFRLGALYEKGEGVTKDLNEARRLYLAAADKGNVNAMHNIGVLYAEGIDGKPDFKIAAQWFRRSALFGVADSQYNLAVLYTRGIGIERNLPEAYRWFAIAAKSGDTDAAGKRDEIAARLDAKSLAAMRQAVETWVADKPPEEGAAVKAPPGGWDQARPAATRKPRQGAAHARSKAEAT